MIKPFDKGNCHDTGLAIDLSAIRMADSSGIGLLMATYNSMRKIGGRFGGRQCFQ